MRSDLHTLFDRGYVTITPDRHFEVSKHIKEEFENGHEYYALHGREIFVPQKIVLQPSGENLSWHNENVYKG
jgi:predicted restriction endonuclease